VTEARDTWWDFDEGRLEVRIDLAIPGTVTAIGPVIERIMELVRETDCAAGSEFEVEVAMTEAVANAVRHGCGDDPDQEVQISVACDPQKGMLVVVRDPGSGFDPGTVPSPVAAENIFRSHGRGVFLINRLMDEVRYERQGTEIRMRKRPE
jgi:serine/threonine-protein kinase RsbW